MSDEVKDILDRIEEDDISKSDIEYGIKYLQYYGYLKENSSSLRSYIKAVRKFQKSFRLSEDGFAGKKTLRAMTTPRCGCPDVFIHDEGPQKKWGNPNLAYFIANRDEDLSAEEWDQKLEEAFNGWSEVCNMKFRRVVGRGNANIIIDIGSGPEEHFDGPGGTLAWAYLPPRPNFNGQLLMRFDTKETWITDPKERGCLLLNVAAHEIGHILGLNHSEIDGALMAPYYNSEIGRPQEHDDIPRIQKLYGQAAKGA